MMLPITYPDGPIFEDIHDKYLVSAQSENFYSALKENIFEDPYLIPGTEGQVNSEKWLQIRPFLFTASEAKKICGLSTENGKKHFLQQHLWGIKKFKGNAATRYGTRMEKTARLAYTRAILKKDPLVTVEETGLWVKEEFPYLGCSLDGLVKKNGTIIRIVELKCPYVLRHVHPKNFSNHLSKTQLENFPLKQHSNGKITMKKDHAYYFQVQMQMDVMKVIVSDFFLWSKKGFLRIEVDYNPSFWVAKRNMMEMKHRGLLIPEYFLMRTPRNLKPWDLNDLEESEVEDSENVDGDL
ncbi:Methionine--tRNA ligase [Frankliniella fusca]|uniref:Methionine--tRNA ligase n=1 Tax=Frankliniella fusca TaxID=407009 RepID=A0AAE1HBN5_9NEOP|nr:Methionine--tRNA ligase [Frankliniella fusca]